MKSMNDDNVKIILIARFFMCNVKEFDIIYIRMMGTTHEVCPRTEQLRKKCAFRIAME